MSIMRRSWLEISNRRLLSYKRLPRQITAQIPSSQSFSRTFSTKPELNNAYPRPNSTGEPPESGGSRTKFLIATAAIGAVIGAYSTGFLDHYFNKELGDTMKGGADDKDLKQSMKESEVPNRSHSDGDTIPVDTSRLLKSINADLEHTDKTDKSLPQLPTTAGPNYSLVQDTAKESSVHIQEEESSKSSLGVGAMGDDKENSETSFEENVNKKSPLNETRQEQHGEAENVQTSSHVTPSSTENAPQTSSAEHLSVDDKTVDVQPHGMEAPGSLIDEYNLKSEAEQRTAAALDGQKIQKAADTLDDEAPLGSLKDSDDAYVSKDGKLILDFLQAIHAAEQRQAELDARAYAEKLRMAKEKYEKELKDARARELMYAEESAMLDKEIKKERAKAGAAVKSLQEQAEERLRLELEQKESEAELRLNEVQELAKAELAASVAREKAAQLEKMAEANLNINALCMAFYARSEEARQSHSIHKLALGALALEDALLKGQPIQAEVDALRMDLEVVEKDSLLDLVLSSLPEEIKQCGTDTPLQLNQKFDELKRTVRHFSFIPRGGGGMLAHSLASLASFLKVKEADKSGDGIESVINRVENLLAEGKLAEAADALEKGAEGSEAIGVVREWVRRARNRAITEQALMLLQSYATSISLS